uniref:PI-PLC X domain-containing protein 1 n=1 Tax=Jaculus jaculus TaxID=51337 RepID=UPI001E1B3A3B|nr:PI-PLC X domain-containing protein 1 [Jaculus jaculus]
MTVPGSSRRSSVHEDWMSSLPPPLWDVPLHHLSIPGSHDSMTYCPDRKSPLPPAQPRLLHLLGRVAPCIARPVALNWAVTQEADVSEQLSCGVRCLDLRVAHAPGDGPATLRFAHALYSTALVEDALTEVAEWLERHPREAAVVAMRGFEGLTPALHERLAACVRNIFGDALCPRGAVPTLRELWARGQQVLVSYEDEATLRRHPELWPGIPRWHGDELRPRDLVRYLDAMTRCGRPGGLFVAGTNLTAGPRHALSRPWASLRAATEAGRPALTTWVREQRPGPHPACTNVIAADFVGAGDALVGDIIALNRKLLPSPPTPSPGFRNVLPGPEAFPGLKGFPLRVLECSTGPPER